MPGSWWFLSVKIPFKMESQAACKRESLRIRHSLKNSCFVQYEVTESRTLPDLNTHSRSILAHLQGSPCIRDSYVRMYIIMFVCMFVCTVICWQTLPYISHIYIKGIVCHIPWPSSCMRKIIIHAQMNSGEMIFYISYGNNLDILSTVESMN